MTQEEKAKAYDEALEWMKKVYPTLTGVDKEDAEHYFPELKESEDERIRKEILEDIRNVKAISSEEYRKKADRWIAWLEKQKSTEWSEEDEAMRDNILRVLSCFFGTSECESNPSLSTLYPAYQKEIDWLKSLYPRKRAEGNY